MEWDESLSTIYHNCVLTAATATKNSWTCFRFGKAIYKHVSKKNRINYLFSSSRKNVARNLISDHVYFRYMYDSEGRGSTKDIQLYPTDDDGQKLFSPRTQRDFSPVRTSVASARFLSPFASKQKARIIFPFRPLPLFPRPPSGEATPTLLPFLSSYGGREEVRGLNCPPSLPPPFLCRIGDFKGRIRKARRAEGGRRGRREMSDLSSLIHTPPLPPFPEAAL